MGEILVLIGIVIIVVGFYLKLDVVAVVLIAGLATGLASGKSIIEILDIIGSGFISNRYMSLFFLTLPVVAVMERYGLKEKAADGIRNKRSECWAYTLDLLSYSLACGSFLCTFSGHIQLYDR